MMRDPIDLGDGHFLQFSEYEGEIAGCSISHKGKNGEDCNGWVAFAGRKWAASFPQGISTWNVVSEEPLTLEPSVLCRVCGDHGHVKCGKWVRA
jgi:hypothetical protein